MSKFKWSALGLAWFRYLLAYPGQLLLALTGIALGIAVVVSIDMAKKSALAAFEQASDAISGKASYRVIGLSGSIDENLYAKLKLGSLPFDFAPKIEVYVDVKNRKRERLRLVGVDPFVEKGLGSLNALNSMKFSASNQPKIAALFSEAGYVLLSKDTAQRLKLGDQEALEIVATGLRKRLKPAAVFEFSDKSMNQAMDDVLLTDIAAAQEIIGMHGRIHYIEVLSKAGRVDPGDVEILERALPDGVELIPYQSINQNARELTASFYINLTALSLLSVIVGMFLIYNTINFLSIRRRGLIGILRALGASRSQIFQLVISESVFLGIIGTWIGILVGGVLAVGMLDLIGKTINDVYFSLPPPRLRFTVPTLIGGLCMGAGVSFLAALFPAFEAIRVQPFQAMTRSRLEANSRTRAYKSALCGIGFLFAGSFITLYSGKSVTFGFTGLMLLVFGCALLTPLFLSLSSRVLSPLIKQVAGVIGALAVRSLQANLSRSGLAVAALMVAISAAVGVQIMVSSFRASVSQWLEQRLSADLYLSAISSARNSPNNPLNEDYLDKISALEEIRSIGTVKRRRLQSVNGLENLSVYSVIPELAGVFEFLAGTEEGIWQEFERKDSVFVTESYAYNRGISTGSIIELTTETGPKNFQVIGIYRDYNPGSGGITMSQKTYLKYWQDSGYSAMSVYAKHHVDLQQLKRKLRSLSDSGLALAITERSLILNKSIEVFDQAFRVTDVLQWLAAMIAFLGVFSVLTAIQLDRIREYGVLRAIGLTSRQLAFLIAGESGLMGLVAGVLALPLGMLIAVVLVFVINQRSFGWSITFHIPPESLFQGLISGLSAAVLAGLIPAYRMTRLSPGNALRYD